MFRTILALIVVFTLVSCADKTAKKEETVAPQATAEKTAKAAKESVKKKTKEVKKKVEAEVENAKPAETAHHEGVLTCKHGNEVRTLEVVKAEGGGCETKYTKGSEAKSVATAKAGTEYCQAAADKIKATLTGAGFTCE